MFVLQALHLSVADILQTQSACFLSCSLWKVKEHWTYSNFVSLLVCDSANTPWGNLSSAPALVSIQPQKTLCRYKAKHGKNQKWQLSLTDLLKKLGLVVRKPINANPGFKFNRGFSSVLLLEKFKLVETSQSQNYKRGKLTLKNLHWWII